MGDSAFPLPWERVRWNRRRLAVSDVRVVALRRGAVEAELALYDVKSVSVERSSFERLTGFGTVVISPSRHEQTPLRIGGVWSARRVALRLNLLITDLRGVPLEDGLVGLPMPRSWRIAPATRLQSALVAPAVLLVTLGVIAIGLSGHERPVAYSANDPIRPNGVKRTRAQIVAFMEHEVMPFARNALGPLVGAEKVRCETCHGEDAEAREWRMPAVQALPEPDVRRMANPDVDAQVRNALHGYLAEDGNQSIAARMRGVVVPGMAKLLHRPAYDFAQTYDYNRERAAFGCYHCHMVR
jgi:hypothetical protein